MAVQTVTERDFATQVLESEQPVLVEFGAEWCGPCKTVAPELEALSRELEGKAKIATIDIDRSPLIAREMGVRSVPTFFVFAQGRPVGGREGALQRAQLREMLEPFLPRARGALKAKEVAELLRRGQISLVDVREPPVFQRAHIAGAANMPLEEIENRLAELHMLGGAPVLYCRGGDKAKELSERLNEQGIALSFLEGGVLEWEASGFSLERPD
jgi:thioredoxin 1/putative thioredoxin